MFFVFFVLVRNNEPKVLLPLIKLQITAYHILETHFSPKFNYLLLLIVIQQARYPPGRFFFPIQDIFKNKKSLNSEIPIIRAIPRTVNSAFFSQQFPELRTRCTIV
jgi:hypothetical protein